MTPQQQQSKAFAESVGFECVHLHESGELVGYLGGGVWEKVPDYSKLQAEISTNCCKQCNGTGEVNSWNGTDTGSNTAENWPGPCPVCKSPTPPAPENL